MLNKKQGHTYKYLFSCLKNSTTSDKPTDRIIKHLNLKLGKPVFKTKTLVGSPENSLICWYEGIIPNSYGERYFWKKNNEYIVFEYWDIYGKPWIYGERFIKFDATFFPDKNIINYKSNKSLFEGRWHSVGGNRKDQSTYKFLYSLIPSSVIIKKPGIVSFDTLTYFFGNILAGSTVINNGSLEKPILNNYEVKEVTKRHRSISEMDYIEYEYEKGSSSGSSINVVKFPQSDTLYVKESSGEISGLIGHSERPSWMDGATWTKSLTKNYNNLLAYNKKIKKTFLKYRPKVTFTNRKPPYLSPKYNKGKEMNLIFVKNGIRYRVTTYSGSSNKIFHSEIAAEAESISIKKRCEEVTKKAKTTLPSSDY